MARIARPPVIVVMGHIDHGKSSLLDYIRKANVVALEAGGITQHVAAYVAEHNDRRITFLDTPGHEAFKALRARGAAAADIAILVVAADEGVKPQTLDALSAIQDAGIPYVVAITKIDKSTADTERAKHSMLEYGIYLEGLGGDITYAPVSSKTGEGIPELLDLVLLTADIHEFTADPDASATGFVLEATQDPRRGASATLIVKDGTLKLGEFVLAGDAYAPVRFIEDFRGKRIQTAGPSEPAQIYGFSKLPSAGNFFSVLGNKKDAEARAHEAALLSIPTRTASAEGVLKLPLVVKADVSGSIEAIAHELSKISHAHIAAQVIASGIGSISENDIRTARTAGGIVIGFNVGADPIARDLAERESVPMEFFSIIYELRERIEELLAERTPIIEAETELGRATILKTFSSTAKKQVAGARLDSGTFATGARIKVLRSGVEVGRGTIGNLQQARANVKEIRTEGEFGVELELRHPIASRDEIVSFRVTRS